MILIAILIPWLSFLLRGKLISGVLCVFLQITLIGWLPAVIWAVLSLNNSKAEKRVRKILESNIK